MAKVQHMITFEVLLQNDAIGSALRERLARAEQQGLDRGMKQGILQGEREVLRTLLSQRTCPLEPVDPLGT